MFDNYEKIKNDFVHLCVDNSLFHGYLFFGPEKEKIADFARRLSHFLELGDFEDDHFLSDSLVISGNESGNIGIDDSRRGQEFLFKKAVISKYRLLIIEDAQLMTAEAQNCLLKTLEEPPENGVIILIANSADAVLSTISSRVQKIYFPSSKRPKNSSNESNEFIAEIENNIIDLAGDLRHNSNKVSIALSRLSKMKQYNLNQKLQARWLKEYLKK